jgi:uncharacterized membrane protein YphA (DoxX/SURF4 family)
MLVLLRITIGWHFFYAGIDKLSSPNFTANGFLSQAKGPLADTFHDLVPDWDGRTRFGAMEVKLGERLDDPKRRAKALESAQATNSLPLREYFASFEQHYHLTKEQQAEAQKALDRRLTVLNDWLADSQGAIEDYFHDLHRLEADRKQPDADVPYQQKRTWEAQTKTRAQLAGFQNRALDIENDLRADLHALLTEAQAKRGEIPQPVSSWFTQDRIVIYSNLAIGMCLMLGLFTRLAALGGALFLLPIVLMQPDWPGLYPPPPPSAGRTFLVGKEAGPRLFSSLFIGATGLSDARG